MTPWLVLAFVVFVFLGGAYWLFVAPMSRAVLRVIQIARDPMHRATPETAWELFDRVVLNRLIPFWLMWAVMLFASCLVGPMMYIFLGPLADQYPLIFFYALIYPAHLAGSWSMAFAGMMLWAPRSGPRGLLARITLTVIGAQGVILLVTWLLLARTAGLATSGKEVWASFAIMTLFTGFAAGVVAWRRARHLGEAWFQFEEERIERAGLRR